MLAVVIILNIMETIKKEEIKKVNFKCKAILLGEVKISDAVEKLLKMKRLEREITRCRTFFVNKDGEIIREYNVLRKDFPVKLYAIPYEDEFEELIKNIGLIQDLPF